MQSILTVTTAATSYDLTELQDVKDELGVTNGASDGILARYISSASLAAMQYCNRVFSSETVSEKFLPEYWHLPVRSGVKPLQLTRWPIQTVVSVTENAVLLVVGTDYLIDSANGQLNRIDSNGYQCRWQPLPLTVVYSAGYSPIPLDVEDAVIRMVTKRFVAKGRDPSLKQRDVPGVLSESYWISTGQDAANMTPDISDVLDNYRVPLTS